MSKQKIVHKISLSMCGALSIYVLFQFLSLSLSFSLFLFLSSWLVDNDAIAMHWRWMTGNTHDDRRRSGKCD